MNLRPEAIFTSVVGCVCLTLCGYLLVKAFGSPRVLTPEQAVRRTSLFAVLVLLAGAVIVEPIVLLAGIVLAPVAYGVIS